MATTTTPAAITKNVTLTIDGREVTVPDGTTVLDAAKQLGIDIPVLCHDDRYDPVGRAAACASSTSARACLPRRACARARRAWRSRPRATGSSPARMLTELLLSDQPDPEHDPKETKTADNELLVLVRQYGARTKRPHPAGPGPRDRRLEPGHLGQPRRLHPLRPLRTRAATTSRTTTSSAAAARATATRIAFDLNDPMGESSCVTCGECVAACPTGALTNKPIRGVPIQPARETPPGRHRLPVLRRRLRAHLPRRRRAQGDLLRRGPRAARIQGPPVRQGPLRLGLRRVTRNGSPSR